MKKFFGMLAIAAVMVACNNEAETTETTDTTTTITTDTSVVAPVDTMMNTDTLVADTTQM